MYDAALGRWFNVDPMAEKYYTKSPYAYCGNSPVMLVDPDGRDFRLHFEWGNDGSLIGLRIETTIWITGPFASFFLANHLTRYAGDFFKSIMLGDIRISFDIKYEYAFQTPSFFSLLNEGKLFRPGDNILEFVNDVSAQTQVFNWSSGQINPNDINRNAIMHETAHMLGLSDRYDKYRGDNTQGGFTESHTGYENDIMGKRASNPDAKLGFDNNNYNFYKSLGNVLPLKVNILLINGAIDLNTKGELITPYEKGGVHQPEHSGRTIENLNYNYDFITKKK